MLQCSSFHVMLILNTVFKFAFVCSKDEVKDPPAPEWAEQELSLGPQTANLLETWFPQSDQSGVSANLMESIRYKSDTFIFGFIKVFQHSLSFNCISTGWKNP